MPDLGTEAWLMLPSGNAACHYPTVKSVPTLGSAAWVSTLHQPAGIPSEIVSVSVGTGEPI
jgi:hypothetical protein